MIFKLVRRVFYSSLSKSNQNNQMQGFIITPLAMPAGHLLVGIHCDCGQMMMINSKNSERAQFQTIAITGQPVLLNCSKCPAKYEIHPRGTHIEVLASKHQ